MVTTGPVVQKTWQRDLQESAEGVNRCEGAISRVRGGGGSRGAGELLVEPVDAGCRSSGREIDEVVVQGQCRGTPDPKRVFRCLR